MAAPGEVAPAPAAAPVFDAFQTAMLAEAHRQSAFAKMAAIEAIHAGNVTYVSFSTASGSGSHEFCGHFTLFVFPPALHTDAPPPLASAQ
jgi:hypothetical protein